jgi:flagellar motor switch protein FliG
MGGDEAAAVLLKVLPPDVLDTIMSRLKPERAESLRERIANLKQKPTGTDRLTGALQTFFNAQKGIVPKSENAEAEGESTQPKPKKKVEKLQLADEAETPIAIHHLRDIPPELLVRVLSDEQIPTVAMVMSVLEPGMATEVMKRFPSAKRPELAVRLTQPGAKNAELTELLAQAVVQKAIKLAAAPPEPTVDDRIRNLATMLRGLKREERLSIVEALNANDPDSCAKVKEQLYLFEDITRIEDKGLQSVLIELDMPTLATALVGSAEDIKAKIFKNMSNRAQGMLNEEIGLLGNVAPAKASLARTKIIGVLRQFEEAGKIVIEV